MPGDKSQRLSNDEKIGAARGVCGLVKDELVYAVEALARAEERAESEDAPRTLSSVRNAKDSAERGLRYLAHLEQEIGPFLSTKEVLVKNERAAGSNVTQ